MYIRMMHKSKKQGIIYELNFIIEGKKLNLAQKESSIIAILMKI